MTPPPDALLFIASQCPHCPGVLAILADMVKAARVGRLEVVNVEAHPERARERGVRSVPWLDLGGFELPGVRGRDELEAWASRAGSPEGLADYFHALLKEGQLELARGVVARDPATLAAVLPIVANPEASINVRIGAGVLFEEQAGQASLRGLVPALGELAGHPDARVRADSCHYLHLTRDAAARPYLVARLQDDDPVVREIAGESLQSLDEAGA